MPAARSYAWPLVAVGVSLLQVDALFYTHFQEKGEPHGTKRNGKTPDLPDGRLLGAFRRLFLFHHGKEAKHDEGKNRAGRMPGVTKEQIQAAREADLFAYHRNRRATPDPCD